MGSVVGAEKRGSFSEQQHGASCNRAKYADDGADGGDGNAAITSVCAPRVAAIDDSGVASVRDGKLGDPERGTNER
jgi:hypothetical protein